MRRPGTSLMQDLAGTTARSSGFLFGVPFFYPRHIPDHEISFEVLQAPAPVANGHQAAPSPATDRPTAAAQS